MSEQLSFAQPRQRSENSRRTYEKIVADGLLGRAYLIVYRHIYEHGPTTRNKLDACLCPGKANPWPSRRLVEMERMGALAVVGQDETGPHRMDLWDVTERLPVPLPKRVSLREVVRQVVSELDKLAFWVADAEHEETFKNMVNRLRKASE